jgi:hypothetical protein
MGGVLRMPIVAPRHCVVDVATVHAGARQREQEEAEEGQRYDPTPELGVGPGWGMVEHVRS